MVERRHPGGGKHRGEAGGGRGPAGPEHAGEWQPYLAVADTVIAVEDTDDPQLVEDMTPEGKGTGRTADNERKGYPQVD